MEKSTMKFNWQKLNDKSFICRFVEKRQIVYLHLKINRHRPIFQSNVFYNLNTTANCPPHYSYSPLPLQVNDINRSIYIWDASQAWMWCKRCLSGVEGM